MSRFGGGPPPPRSSAGDNLAYGDIPQRWDRDRFERFGSGRPAPGPPPAQHFEEEYRYTERDRPGRRDVAVAERIDERNGPGGLSYHERDRYVEEDRFAPPASAGRPRRRTDRELFGDVDPREIAEMALQPYRRKHEDDFEIERQRAPVAAPRPGLLRRQSSLDTFDRRPSAAAGRSVYGEEEVVRRLPAYQPVPLPIRRHEDIYEEEEARYRAPVDYREVEIQRERSVHRRRGGGGDDMKSSKAPSEAPTRKTRSTRAKSVTTRRTSPSSESSESFSEVEKAESIRESIAETRRGFKKGKTRMPKRLVRSEAIQDLGYPYDEEESFYVLRIALEKDQIDEVIKISEQYKEGGNKTVYRFEEKIHEQQIPVAAMPPPPMGEHEVIEKTEWINPPTVIMTGGGGARSERARTVRAPSPSAQSSVSRRISPARTTRTRSRRPSSPGTYVEERRTVFEERGPPQPMPPPMMPMGSIPVPAEYYEERRTVVDERFPPPPPPGAPGSPLGGALVVRERTDYRSDRDIQSEIRQLEAERRALRLEREAEEKRDMALRLRTDGRGGGMTEEEYQMVEYREGGRRGDREVLQIVERERSPKRDVVRVEKDRKGRLALVRSAH
ncbi:hypothetical protein LTR27_012228 [Elasticomyces elasticus]|nr:hypothetical protein LTR27_012228 [Elasticomyces elasticus]